MKNIFKIDFYNNQSVMVFNDYKFYDDEVKVKKDKGNYLYSNFLSTVSKLESSSYLGLNVHPLESDLVKWAEYESLNVRELEAMLFNFKEIDESKKERYKEIITGFTKNEDDFKLYKLSDSIGLYTELAKVTPFDLKEILKFIKAFGLPCGLFETYNTSYVGDYPVSIQATNYAELNFKLIEYRFIFDVFKNLFIKDGEKARERELNINLKHIEYSLKDSDKEFLQKLNEGIKNESENQSLEKESYFFSDLINTKKFLKPFFDIKQDDFVMEIVFDDLFDYAYFQMTQAIINKVEFKECEFCGHIFEATTDKMRFCPALPFRKRSSCEMAYNNRKRKIR